MEVHSRKGSASDENISALSVIDGFHQCVVCRALSRGYFAFKYLQTALAFEFVVADGIARRELQIGCLPVRLLRHIRRITGRKLYRALVIDLLQGAKRQLIFRATLL